MGRLFFKSNEIISFNFEGLSFVPQVEISDLNLIKKVEPFKGYKIADCKLPKELEEWVFIKQLGERIVKQRENLVRMLICQKYLLAYNPLPQVYISKYLDIRRNTLKSWIDDFVRLGWLKIFSPDYGKGQMAIRYSAHGELSETIMAYHNFKSRRDCYGEVHLPVKINDGEWNDTLFISSFKFSSDLDNTNFINWVKTIDGWDKKTRLVQAHNAFAGMKKFALKNKFN